MARVGVLALQGGFAPHLTILKSLGHSPIEVRRASDLADVDGLILPGGESTAQLWLLERDVELRRALSERIESGLPLLATCAGLILAARAVTPAQACFSWIDVSVRRNAYGPQLESFEGFADDGHTPLMMIRAPRIEEVGPSVEVLATLHGEPVLVRQGRRYGASYHPELSLDSSLHLAVFGSLLS